jgi:hypothetical protein
MDQAEGLDLHESQKESLLPTSKSFPVTKKKQYEAHDRFPSPCEDDGTPNPPYQDDISEYRLKPIVQVTPTFVKYERSFLQELKGWFWEISACFLLAGVLIGISWRLAVQNGKPLPQWPLSVTINSLLTFHIYVVKAAMLFIIDSTITQCQWLWFDKERPLYDAVQYNEAVNDLLPSVLIFLNEFWRFRRPLTTFGIFILLFSNLIDFFVQQLVQYTDCEIVIANTTLPRTRFYHPKMLEFKGDSIIENMIGITDQIVILSGIFTNPSSIPFSCSTGNCTFPFEYSTIAFCTQCQDISNTLEFNISYVANLPPSNVTAPATPNMLWNITSSLPSGLSISSLVDNNPSGDNHYNYFAGGWNGSHQTNFDFILARLNASIPEEYSDVEWVSPNNDHGTDCDNSENAQNWQCQGYGAASCSLSPCVVTYRSDASAGKLNETVLSVELIHRTQSYYNDSSTGEQMYSQAAALLDTTCASPTQLQNLADIGYVIDATNRWLPINITWSLFEPSQGNEIPFSTNVSFPQSLESSECLFMISQPFIEGLYQSFLSKQLRGVVTAMYSPNVYKTMINDYQGPIVLQDLFSYQNVTFEMLNQSFSNLASTMTNHIRQNGSPLYSSPTRGSVTHYASCVQIQWSWMIFPIGLAVLTVFHLLFLIFANWRAQAPLWKHSLLPFIFHGPGVSNWPPQVELDASFEDMHESGLISLEDMEDTAKSITFQLESSGCRVKMVQIDDNRSAPARKAWWQRAFTKKKGEKES